jgi:probable rRNA maturation factor
MMQNFPVSSEPAPLEVIVQDYFFESAASCPIAEATWQTWFQQWLTLLKPGLKPDWPDASAYELCLRLTDDAEIRSLNADYRQKDQPTDVLAFSALELNAPQPAEMQDFPLYLGDVVISVETAQRQAAERDHSILQELSWLAAHAFLHLLGWDHPDEASLLSMLKQQELLLQSVGLTLRYDEHHKK